MSNKHHRYKPINPDIEALASQHHHEKTAVLEILKTIQASHGSLTQEAITDTARALKIPAALTFGVASFYSMLSL